MSNDRLQKWALIAEVIGAVAVVISLIFVGIELRSNTEATRAATREAINQKDIDFLLAVTLAFRTHRFLGNPLIWFGGVALLVQFFAGRGGYVEPVHDVPTDGPGGPDPEASEPEPAPVLL